MREEMRGLAQSIVASHEARSMGFASIRRDASAQRESAQRHVQELGATRRDAARTLHGHLARGRADLGSSVSAELQGLDRAHNAMARQQRESLAKVHAGLNRAETRRKARVHSWMEEVAADHRAAREEWQNLAVTMQAKRAGIVVAEAPREVAPAPLAVEEAAPLPPRQRRKKRPSPK